MYKSGNLITPPAKEPVTLEEVLGILRLEAGVDDDVVNSLIATARDKVEIITGRQMVTATRQLVLNNFPSGDLVIANAPLQSVELVRYHDGEEWVELVEDTDYIVEENGGGDDPDPLCDYGFIHPVDSWPCVGTEPNSVEVTYICGYPLDVEDDPTTPEALKNAIKFQVADLYDVCSYKDTINYILASYRLNWQV